MIITTTQYQHITLQSPRLAQIIEQVMTNHPADLPTGITHIDGDNIFVNRISARTKCCSESLSEVHHQYIDVHVVLSGTEGYAAPLTPTTAGHLAAYDPESDAALCQNIADEQHFILEPNQCAVFFPGEWHRPLLNHSGSDAQTQQVEKIVIKIKAETL